MYSKFGKSSPFTTKGNYISESGCFKLVDAVFWMAICDVIKGWRYYQNHPDDSLIQNAHYCSAVRFLKSNEKGKRIWKILENLTDEQRAALIEKGGLATSYYDGKEK